MSPGIDTRLARAETIARHGAPHRFAGRYAAPALRAAWLAFVGDVAAVLDVVADQAEAVIARRVEVAVLTSDAGAQALAIASAALEEVGDADGAHLVRSLLDVDEAGAPRIDPPTGPLASVVPLGRRRPS